MITRCNRITEKIDESVLDVQHEFMTEDDMKVAGFPQSHGSIIIHLICGTWSLRIACQLRWKIDGIKAYCKDDDSLTRSRALFTLTFAQGLEVWRRDHVLDREENYRKRQAGVVSCRCCWS